MKHAFTNLSGASANIVRLLGAVLCVAHLEAAAQRQYSDTPFDRTRRSLNGFTLALGAIQGNFFSPVLQDAVRSNTIQPKPGFLLEVRYAVYPVTFDFAMYNASYQLDAFGGQPADGGLTARHTGGEIGATIGLFHFNRLFVPFVGAGYQKGILGTGVLWLGVKDSDTEDPVSVTDLSAPVVKCGFDLHLKKFTFRGEYRRGLISERDYHQFALTLGYLTSNF